MAEISAELLKKNAELHESEERFRQVAESADEWIWEVDPHGKYTYSSPVVEKILGYKPEELVGQKYFFDLFAPEAKEGLKKTAFEAFNKKKPIKDLINVNVKKNGDRIILETTGVPIIDNQGKLLGYRGADLDVTERQKMIDRIRKSEEDLRKIIESAPFGVMVIGQDKIIRLVNKAALKMSGHESASELVGKVCHETLCPAEYNKCPIIDQGKTLDRSEKILIKKDGQQIPILKSVVCLTLGGEEVLLECFIDIAEHKIAERERCKRAEELETMNKFMVGRELDMVNLKNEVNDLLVKLGQPKKY